jgi:hypothetical protein
VLLSRRSEPLDDFTALPLLGFLFSFLETKGG